MKVGRKVGRKEMGRCSGREVLAGVAEIVE